MSVKRFGALMALAVLAAGAVTAAQAAPAAAAARTRVTSAPVTIAAVHGGAKLRRAGSPGAKAQDTSFSCTFEANAVLYPGDPRYWSYYVTGRCTIAMDGIELRGDLFSTNNPTPAGQVSDDENFVNIAGASDELTCAGDGLCIGHWVYEYRGYFYPPSGYTFTEASGPCSVESGGALLACYDRPEGDVTG